jgi:uncharacterized protein YjdB
MKKIENMKVFTGKSLTVAVLLSGALIFGACSENDKVTEGNAIAIKALSVTPENIVLAVGEIRAAKATVTPDGANQEIYWKSADPNIATVANGIITGIAEGETTVSVTSITDVSKRYELRIQVVKAAVPVESIAFNTPGQITIYIGDEFPLQVIFTPENVSNNEILWKNSNPAIATFENGIIKGLDRGATVITAMAGADVNKKVSLEVLVTNPGVPVESISVSPEKITLVAGNSKTLTFTVNPIDASNRTLAWESSDNTVATVSEGTVTAHAPGIAYITARSAAYPDISATVTVLVPDLSVFPAVFAEAAGLWTFNNSSDITKAIIGADLVTKGSGNAIVPITGLNAVTIPSRSYFEASHGIAANGGGNSVNEYTLMIDFRIPVASKWYAFFQTNLNNSDDAECFVRNNNTIGVGNPGYSSATIAANTWYRLIITAKLGTSYDIYLDGISIFTTPADRLSSIAIDSHFALSPNGIALLCDNDGEDSDINVSSIAIWGRQFSASEINALGGASSLNW